MNGHKCLLPFETLEKIVGELCLRQILDFPLYRGLSCRLLAESFLSHIGPTALTFTSNVLTLMHSCIKAKDLNTFLLLVVTHQVKVEQPDEDSLHSLMAGLTVLMT